MLYKAIPGNFKANAAAFTVEGYAAVFGNVDLAGDVIKPGAFAETLKANLGSGKIRYLWMHDPFTPIGVVTEAKEDDKGLWIKASIAKTQRGAELIELVKIGAISEQSIGYDVGASEKHPELKTADGQPATWLTKIGLWECSSVTFGANTMTTLAAKAKGIGVQLIRKNGLLMAQQKADVAALTAGVWVTWQGDEAAMTGRVIQVATAAVDGMPNGMTPTAEDPAVQVEVWQAGDTGEWTATGTMAWAKPADLTVIEEPAPAQPAEAPPPSATEAAGAKADTTAPQGFRMAAMCGGCANFKTGPDGDEPMGWCAMFKTPVPYITLCDSWAQMDASAAEPAPKGVSPARAIKAGRVLSAKNMGRITQARDLLVEAIEDAARESDTPKSAPKPEAVKTALGTPEEMASLEGLLRSFH